MMIRTCASSANLGPGFDCFGIAWQLYNDIEFTLGGEGLEISGCAEGYCGEDNLAYRAYLAVLDCAGIEPEPLKIRFAKTNIPVSRGLGSSAALISGGVVAANELHSLGLSKAELIEIATGLEGHPDNVAPALLGGLMVSAMDEERVISRRMPLSHELRFTALVPGFELSTTLARGVLPPDVKRADAIFNVSHAALLLQALSDGDADLLRFALDDRLHQPYRKKLIHGCAKAEKLALGCGAIGVCISGAGSTLLCVSGRSDTAVKIEEKMRTALPGWRVIPLAVDSEGARAVDIIR